MPRVLQLLAVVLAFVVSGAPTWISELAEDDCAEQCTTDAPSGCPEGCGDCSIVCSSCPRSHVVVPSLVASVAPIVLDLSWIASEARQRVPDDPVAEGVFHPPRFVAG